MRSVVVMFIFATAISAQTRNEAFENFKREMLPQVDKKITVSGTLDRGKLGWVVSFKGWQIYIYATKDSDVRRMNDLNRFADHTVEVTGTLKYFPEPEPVKSDRIVAIPPEHFYFDVAEAKVTSIKNPEPAVKTRKPIRKRKQVK